MTSVLQGFAIAITFLLPFLASAESFTDATGKNFSFEKPVRRIITLAPHLTELLYAAGAGEKIVATVEYSDYPAEAKKIPRIGNATRIDMEALLALKPDLVLGWLSGNRSLDLDKLSAFSVPVFYSDVTSLEDIPNNITLLGDMAGTAARASQATQAFKAKYALLAKKYKQKKPVSVFLQIWNQPLMSINAEHLINHVIQLCGGKNVFASAPVLIPHLSTEAVVAADPEVIIATAVEGRAHLEEWKRWKSLRAVHNGFLFTIPADLMHRQSPRILEGAAMMCEQLDKARQ